MKNYYLLSFLVCAVVLTLPCATESVFVGEDEHFECSFLLLNNPCKLFTSFTQFNFFPKLKTKVGLLNDIYDSSSSLVADICTDACRPVKVNHLFSDETTRFCLLLCSLEFATSDVSDESHVFDTTLCDRLVFRLCRRPASLNLAAVTTQTPLRVLANTTYQFCHSLHDRGFDSFGLTLCYEAILDNRPHSPRVMLDLAFVHISHGRAALGQSMALSALQISITLAGLQPVPVNYSMQHSPVIALAELNFVSSAFYLNSTLVSEYIDDIDDFETFIDQAQYAYAWSLFEQSQWITLLEFSLLRMMRTPGQLDPVYYPFMYQAAQQTADVPVLRRWEPFGADILALLLDPDSEANIHPFATLSWSFATPLLLKQIAEMVSRYYIRRCEHPIVWETSGTKGNQVWSPARTALVESIWEQTELAHEDHARAKRGQMLIYDRESVARLLAASPYTTRLRVGYLASHFRQQHPIGNLCQSMLAMHDRRRVEVFCYSLTRPVNTSLEHVFHQACEHFVPCYAGPLDHLPEEQRLDAMNAHCRIGEHGSEQLRVQLRNDRIQILVDLDGYMELRPVRLGALCSSPAPIAINFLGFPGTMGASFLPLMIADRVTGPDHHIHDYSERLVRLPFTYFPCSYREVFAEEVRSTAGFHQALSREGVLDMGDGGVAKKALAALRHEFQLPLDRFLFVSFNALNKLAPHSLTAAITIMQQTPHSSLVLLDPALAPHAQRTRDNIFKFAVSRNVTADRILFAARLPLHQHMRRLAAFDLMLDSFPYNAHTTTADALWAGLPVLTFPQSRMAGRVASSQLFASSCLSRLAQHWQPELIGRVSDSLKSIFVQHDTRRQRWLERYRKRTTLDSRNNAIGLGVPTSGLTESARIRAEHADEQLFVQHSLEAYREESADTEKRNATFGYFRAESTSLPVHVVPFHILRETPFGDLVATSERHYIDMAVFFAFATDARLEWRDCLERHRWTAPLFDTRRYVRDLELAYAHLWSEWLLQPYANGDWDSLLPLDIRASSNTTYSAVEFEPDSTVSSLSATENQDIYRDELSSIVTVAVPPHNAIEAETFEGGLSVTEEVNPCAIGETCSVSVLADLPLSISSGFRESSKVNYVADESMHSSDIFIPIESGDAEPKRSLSGDMFRLLHTVYGAGTAAVPLRPSLQLVFSAASNTHPHTCFTPHEAMLNLPTHLALLLRPLNYSAATLGALQVGFCIAGYGDITPLVLELQQVISNEWRFSLADLNRLVTLAIGYGRLNYPTAASIILLYYPFFELEMMSRLPEQANAVVLFRSYIPARGSIAYVFGHALVSRALTIDTIVDAYRQSLFATGKLETSVSRLHIDTCCLVLFKS